MANEQNLKHFTSEYQPANRGRKKGSRNLSTILIEALSSFAPGEIDKDLVKELCRGKKRAAMISRVFMRPSLVTISTKNPEFPKK